MVGSIKIGKPGWLTHEDLFGKVTIEECIVNIKLTDGPMKRYGNKEDKSNDCRSNNETKSVKIINSFNLIVALGH